MGGQKITKTQKQPLHSFYVPFIENVKTLNIIVKPDFKQKKH